MYFKEILNKIIISNVKQALLEQKQKFDLIKNIKFNNSVLNFNANGQVFLKENTLVHGTKFNMDKLKNIKESGILASEFADNKPDLHNETFYMADFFKVTKKGGLTVKEMLSCFDHNKVVNYLPLNKETTSPKLAFVINNNQPLINKYLKLDLFNNDNNEKLYSFIDEEMFFSINRRQRLYQYNYKLGQSSIPIGLPYSAISSVIVDKTIENNKNKELDLIKGLFGADLNIISVNGKVISKPKLNYEEREF